MKTRTAKPGVCTKPIVFFDGFDDYSEWAADRYYFPSLFQQGPHTSCRLYSFMVSKAMSSNSSPSNIRSQNLRCAAIIDEMIRSANNFLAQFGAFSGTRGIIAHKKHLENWIPPFVTAPRFKFGKSVKPANIMEWRRFPKN